MSASCLPSSRVHVVQSLGQNTPAPSPDCTHRSPFGRTLYHTVTIRAVFSAVRPTRREKEIQHPRAMAGTGGGRDRFPANLLALEINGPIRRRFPKQPVLSLPLSLAIYKPSAMCKLGRRSSSWCLSKRKKKKMLRDVP